MLIWALLSSTIKLQNKGVKIDGKFSIVSGKTFTLTDVGWENFLERSFMRNKDIYRRII
jgi:hypothetical protein